MEFIKWLVTSSEDPLKFSVTARAVLTIAGAWFLHASMLACGFGIYCLGVDDQAVNQAVIFFTNAAYGLALIVGSMMGVYGLIRKMKNGRWSAA